MSDITKCCEHCKLAQEDHNLLIKIDVGVSQLTMAKDDHEKRLRNLERFGFIGLGILYAVEFFRTWSIK